MKKIINAKLLSNQNVEVLIDCDKIVKISTKIDQNAEIIDANGGYVFSGLVNCFFNGNERDVERLLQQGITSVFDFSFDDFVTEKLIKKGIKVYKAIGDHNGNIVLTKDFILNEIEKYKAMGVKDIILYAKNPNLCDESNYSELINIASDYGYLLATSASENLEDVGEIDNEYSLSPVGLLESYGFFDQRHMLIDCVYTDKDDVNILVNYDTNVCTCPTNNLKNGNGIAPVFSFLKNKLNVVVGGVSSNHIKEITLVKDLQSGVLNEMNLITDEDCFSMATENARKIFDSIGELKENELADIVISSDNEFLNITPLDIQMVLVDGDVKYKRI